MGEQEWSFDAGCGDAERLAVCLENRQSNRSVLRMSVSNRATLPINRASSPALEMGDWVIVLKPWDRVDVHKVTMSIVQAPRARLWLAGALVLVVPPLLVVAMWMTFRRKECSGRNAVEQLPGVGAFLLAQLRGSLLGPSYAAQVCLVAGAFFLAGFQLAISVWFQGRQAGDRDMRHYNYACYHPVGFDVPFNSILSHLPYIVCGLVSVLLIGLMEFGLRQGDSTGLDLRLFYALGVAEIAEALGSICYHICLQQVQFPFDAAMMYVTALLTVLALNDIDAAGTDTATAPSDLFLLLILPLWLVGFLGTWTDMDYITGTASWVLYVLVAFCWSCAVVCKARVLVPLPCCDAGRRRAWCARVFAGILLFALLVVPGIDTGVGGTPKLLLGLCMAVMIFTCVRQLYRHDWPITRGEWRRHRRGMALGRLAPMGMVVAVGACAMWFYYDTPYSSSSPPWKSHSLNQPCILLGTFDSHDVWHILSAIALALWTLVLCEVRVRVWEHQADRTVPACLPTSLDAL